MTLVNIQVENLSKDVSNIELQKAFESYGELESVNIIKEGDKPKNIAFVVMKLQREAKAAINGLNNTKIQGSNIKVFEVPSY